jgi:hypothetical protein
MVEVGIQRLIQILLHVNNIAALMLGMVTTMVGDIRLLHMKVQQHHALKMAEINMDLPGTMVGKCHLLRQMAQDILRETEVEEVDHK